jgi:putative FmdB family regulatory protein
MPTYEAGCPKCGKQIDYVRAIADRNNIPKCKCGTKMVREFRTPIQVSPMIWTSHQSQMIGGKWCETATDYKRVMKEGNFISETEGKQEAKRVKTRRAKEEDKKLESAVLQAFDQVDHKKRIEQREKRARKKAA